MAHVTIESLAKRLEEAGMKRVRALVLARGVFAAKYDTVSFDPKKWGSEFRNAGFSEKEANEVPTLLLQGAIMFGNETRASA